MITAVGLVLLLGGIAWVGIALARLGSAISTVRADLDALEDILRFCKNEPVVVVANAGTVNTGDFDDIEGLVKLKEKYNFIWWVTYSN